MGTSSVLIVAAGSISMEGKMPAVRSHDVKAAAAVLRAGGLVAFTTETVYGLGADALRERAVAGIFEAKGRPTFDPLIVHVAEKDQLSELLVEPLTGKGKILAERFWPGPMTLVLPKRPTIPDLVTSGLKTVAVRIPSHPLAQALLREFGGPIAAPSANLFGAVSPTTAEHVAEQLQDRIDFILDGGSCDVGVESTVLHVAGEQVTLLRPGGLTLEDIESAIGPVVCSTETHDEKSGKIPASPGMMNRHYAPRTPLRLFDDWAAIPPPVGKVAALGFQSVPRPERFCAVEVLSPEGDLREAAARFFAALRRLDSSGAHSLYAVRLPDQGLGLAINNRLARAQHRLEL